MEIAGVLNLVKMQVWKDEHGRKALSSQYPAILPIILGVRRLVNKVKYHTNPNFFGFKNKVFFRCVVARHSSPLFRKLGDSDQNLQKGKVKNLIIAIDALNGIIIPPNKTFSFWKIVGATTEKKGYVKGMLLSDGKVTEGVGGGLCQLSNLLYWLFLHTPVEIIERKHHSRDAFPDNGRTIPFGAGATIFYNLIDLKIKNISKHPIQLKLWLSDTQLKGQVLSTKPFLEKFHLKEENHYFVKTPCCVYRYNEIWRETLVEGKTIQKEKIVTNCAPVMYTPSHIDLFLK